MTAEEVVRRVAGSRRYGSVDAGLVRKLAEEELPKSRNLSDAEKRTRRRLHQIFGAYATAALGRPADAATAFQGISTDLNDPVLRAHCQELLRRHASSRERIDLLDTFYRQVFAVTGRPATILDLACGLNPLALPWMDLPLGLTYHAYDVDLALIALVDAFLSHVGVTHTATVQDVIANPPAIRADVALLLKTLPCLEHQQAGAGARLLRAVDARHVVVSYPTRSLGGRGKGLARTYRQQFQQIVAGERWTVQEIELANELVYVVRTRD